VRTLKTFQGTHILGASCGLFAIAQLSCLKTNPFTERNLQYNTFKITLNHLKMPLHYFVKYQCQKTTVSELYRYAGDLQGAANKSNLPCYFC